MKLYIIAIYGFKVIKPDLNTCPAIQKLQRAKFLFIQLWLIFIYLRLAKESFSQLWSILLTYLSVPCLYKWGDFINLRAIYTTVIDFHTFEGPTSMTVIGHYCQRCRQLGIEIHILTKNGWMVARGFWLSQDLNRSMKQVIWSKDITNGMKSHNFFFPALAEFSG